MKYQKLKQICEKKRKYVKIGYWIIISAIISMFLLGAAAIWLAICGGTLNEGIIIVCGVITICLIVANSVLGQKEEKMIRAIEDYVVIKIMDVINEYGIAPGNFEIFQTSCGRYKIGFHNQMIDYDKLQEKIDTELVAMNKIAKSNMRFKLI